MVEYNGATVRDYSADAMPQTRTALDIITANPNAITNGETTLLRRETSTSGVTITSQQMRFTYFTAKKTEVINNIGAATGGTAAAATPTVCRLGLYLVDPTTQALSLVASTPNDTTLFATASTLYSKALSVPYEKIRGQRYAVGLLIVTAAATPGLYGSASILAAIAGIAPKLSGTLNGQADLPSTVTDSNVVASGSAIFSHITS